MAIFVFQIYFTSVQTFQDEQDCIGSTITNISEFYRCIRAALLCCDWLATVSRLQRRFAGCMNAQVPNAWNNFRGSAMPYIAA